MNEQFYLRQHVPVHNELYNKANGSALYIFANNELLIPLTVNIVGIRNSHFTLKLYYKSESTSALLVFLFT